MTISFRKNILIAFAVGLAFGVTGTGIAATVLGSSVFSDVTRGSFYDSAIGQMYSDGIIKGYDNGKFGPDDAVTRGQLAVMLQRFKAELQGTVVSSSSSSSNSSSSTTSSSSSSSTASVSVHGAFRFTTSTFSIPGTNSALAISVIRAGGSTGSATVQYSITAGTAVNGTDFTAGSGTLAYADGETTKNLTVHLISHAASSSRTVNLTLSTTTGGATLTTPSSAVLTLLGTGGNTSTSTSTSTSTTSAGASSSVNSNGTFSFGAQGYAVAENGGPVTITVVRAGGTAGTVAVNYATSDGSGHAGSEYTATNGTLTFNGGETTKSFTVAVADDSATDGSKTFNLTLTNATGGANIGNNSATTTILDDESMTIGSGSLKFSKATYAVVKSTGQAVITVLRTGGAQGTASVDYSTSSGTAYSGPDFTSTSGTLTFAPYESSKTIIVPLVKDSESSGSDKSFSMYLTNPTPSSVTLIDPYSATVSIQ